MLAFATIINLLLIISLTIFAIRKPLLVSINNLQTKLLKVSEKIPQDFITQKINRAITRFIQLRYSWTDKNIDSQLKKSSQFIATRFKSEFF